MNYLLLSLAMSFLCLLSTYAEEFGEENPASITCANVRCGTPTPLCVDFPTGPRCVKNRCQTVKCSAETECIETDDGPQCQPKHMLPIDEECPGGIPQVRCQDPCVTCKKGTRCVPDKCNPCVAKCESACPGGRPVVNCFVEPCSVKRCAKGEKCVPDECAPCSATCVKDDSSGSSGGSGACPDGSDPVNCRIKPCDATKCGEREVCEPNFCGGCNAVCKCPDGSPPVKCLIDPCSSKKCTYGKTCVTNYCGGCNAECKYP